MFFSTKTKLNGTKRCNNLFFVTGIIRLSPELYVFKLTIVEKIIKVLNKTKYFFIFNCSCNILLRMVNRGSAVVKIVLKAVCFISFRIIRLSKVESIDKNGSDIIALLQMSLVMSFAPRYCLSSELYECSDSSLYVQIW